MFPVLDTNLCYLLISLRTTLTHSGPLWPLFISQRPKVLLTKMPFFAYFCPFLPYALWTVLTHFCPLRLILANFLTHLLIPKDNITLAVLLETREEALSFWPSWTNLDRFGPFWTDLDQFGRLRSTSVHFGPLWTTLDYFGQLWTTLDNFGQLWTTLGNFGQLWIF